MSCPNCKSGSYVEKSAHVYPGPKESESNIDRTSSDWDYIKLRICKFCGVWYSEPDK